MHIENGGWHFTNVKTPKDIEKKLSNYTHHYEFEQSGLDENDLRKKISDRKIIYDHGVDQKNFKWNSEKTLKKIDLNQLPDYIQKNSNKYVDWLDA